MKRFNDIIDAVQLPEPKFNLHLNEYEQIVATPIVNPILEACNSIESFQKDPLYPIAKIAIERYLEFSIQRSQYKLDKRYAMPFCQSSLRDALLKAIQNNLRLKKAKFHSLSNFVRRADDSNISVFIELFIYLQSHNSVESSFIDHIMNVYLILERMKEKYDRESQQSTIRQ